MSLKKYIKNKKVVHFTWNGVEILQKDHFSNSDISLKLALKKLSALVPVHLMRNLDFIYIGQFKTLKDRDLQAVYENGAIFVTNEQENEEDLIDDLVHEIAHSVEEEYKNIIYADGKIEKEFIQKRKELWLILREEGYSAELQAFLEPEYNEVFDTFLYKEVGYPALSMLTVNMFYSPYGCTSLREYFANGFEGFFFHRDINRIKAISPTLNEKYIKLLELKEDEYGS